MKKRTRKKESKEVVKATGKPPVEKDDDKTDYGGIPNRNLKINLGCG